mgnify:CR=1 FL=1
MLSLSVGLDGASINGEPCSATSLSPSRNKPAAKGEPLVKVLNSDSPPLTTAPALPKVNNNQRTLSDDNLTSPKISSGSEQGKQTGFKTLTIQETHQLKAMRPGPEAKSQNDSEGAAASASPPQQPLADGTNRNSVYKQLDLGVWGKILGYQVGEI